VVNPMQIIIPNTHTGVYDFSIVTYILITPEDYYKCLNGPLDRETWNHTYQHVPAKPGTYSVDGRIVYARTTAPSPILYHCRFPTERYHTELDGTYIGWAVLDMYDAVIFTPLNTI